MKSLNKNVPCYSSCMTIKVFKWDFTTLQCDANKWHILNILFPKLKTILLFLKDVRNTIGNVPIHWYDDYEHIGYDVEGRKLIKPKQGDELDEFLDKADNPDYWWALNSSYT